MLVQPVVATAWAPTERLFLQGAAQFDIDPFGNPDPSYRGMVRFTSTDPAAPSR